ARPNQGSPPPVWYPTTVRSSVLPGVPVSPEPASAATRCAHFTPAPTRARRACTSMLRSRSRCARTITVPVIASVAPCPLLCAVTGTSRAAATRTASCTSVTVSGSTIAAGCWSTCRFQPRRTDSQSGSCGPCTGQRSAVLSAVTTSVRVGVWVGALMTGDARGSGLHETCTRWRAANARADSLAMTAAPGPAGTTTPQENPLPAPDHTALHDRGSSSGQGLPAAVLWDMDGTLVDTEPYWMAAEVELSAEHGGSWDESLALDLVGMSLEAAAAELRARAGIRGTISEIVHELMQREVTLVHTY